MSHVTTLFEPIAIEWLRSTAWLLACTGKQTHRSGVRELL